ncbi:MAG: McrB family protein, partial [Acetatifactor sp.]
GTSGTGKTRLVRLFSEAIGAKYKLVSVRPDWSDSSDLFGHVNLKGEFVPGAIIKYIHEAAEPENLNTPYFLCLDEMNLARVEYYLSDFLSIIETRHRENGHVVTDEIILDKDAKDIYGKLILPENLYVIGTVNMDETTFPFSKKVLDRANTIEFSYVGLVPDFSEIPEVVEAQTCGNNLLKTEYITLMSDVDEEDRQFVTDICVELQEINKILQSAQAHVGYRVRDEIVFYMLNNKKAELLDKDLAFDNEIMQKILPRIQGSSTSIKEMLCELFKKCAGDYTGLSQASVSEQMQAYIETKDCKYRKSAEKICYMMRRFEEDGFTSYWL